MSPSIIFFKKTDFAYWVPFSSKKRWGHPLLCYFHIILSKWDFIAPMRRKISPNGVYEFTHTTAGWEHTLNLFIVGMLMEYHLRFHYPWLLLSARIPNGVMIFSLKMASSSQQPSKSYSNYHSSPHLTAQLLELRGTALMDKKKNKLISLSSFKKK